MHPYELDTPAILVDLSRMEENIARYAGLAANGGKKLRPHTKTHKTPEIAKMQIAAGADGITIAKLGEAEVMFAAGIGNLFIANQIVGAPKVDRLMKLLDQTTIQVGVDSMECAAPIGRAAADRGLTQAVRVEIDTGTGRAGVRSVPEAVELGKRVADTPGLRLSGIYTYEPRTDLRSAAETLRQVAAGLQGVGLAADCLSVGSTPGAQQMAREPGITELRSGTYVFGDVMQTTLGTLPASCALSVLVTVISRPDLKTAIVDGGTKTFSGDKGDSGSRHGTVMEDAAVIFDWANEEHGHLDLGSALIQPKVGDKLRIVPWHVCACVNMHDTMWGTRDDKVETEWRIAGRGKLQ